MQHVAALGPPPAPPPAPPQGSSRESAGLEARSNRVSDGCSGGAGGEGPGGEGLGGEGLAAADGSEQLLSRSGLRWVVPPSPPPWPSCWLERWQRWLVRPTPTPRPQELPSTPSSLSSLASAVPVFRGARLLATSDLHVDFAANMALVEAIPKQVNGRRFQDLSHFMRRASIGPRNVTVRPCSQSQHYLRCTIMLRSP